MSVFHGLFPLCLESGCFCFLIRMMRIRNRSSPKGSDGVPVWQLHPWVGGVGRSLPVVLSGPVVLLVESVEAGLSVGKMFSNGLSVGHVRKTQEPCLHFIVAGQRTKTHGSSTHCPLLHCCPLSQVT